MVFLHEQLHVYDLVYEQVTTTVLFLFVAPGRDANPKRGACIKDLKS